jgi:FixJ family two-component response regulator
MDGNKRVLIIEDDAQQCETLCKLFARHHVDAECAHSMGEGLACLRTHDYSCVVLDPGLPDVPTRMDAVHQIPDFGCPCVVLTGSEDNQLLREARRLGAHYILKASGVELVLEQVFQAIEHVDPSEEVEDQIFQHQRQLRTVQQPWYTRWSALGGFIIALMGFIGTGSAVLFDSLKSDVIDSRTLIMHDEKLKLQEMAVRDLDNKAQRSIDDRNVLHRDLSGLADSQKAFKEDIIRRLERIEDKLDRKTP